MLKLIGTAEALKRFQDFLNQVAASEPTDVDTDSGLLMDGAPLVGRNTVHGPALHAGDWVSSDRSFPPPAAPASYFVDDAGWTDAVGRDGVRIPYGDEYYKSQHFELLKAELLTGRCAMCDRTVRTTLHHRDYRHMGQERSDDVTEICQDCHAKIHATRQRRAA